jgi:SlyX protein
MSNSVEQRIEQLEFRIAYLEQNNATLSDTLVQQQKEIEALKARFGLLAQKLEAAQSQPTEYSAEDEKPPHY